VVVATSGIAVRVGIGNGVQPSVFDRVVKFKVSVKS
jgi:hypothetical protein